MTTAQSIALGLAMLALPLQLAEGMTMHKTSGTPADRAYTASMATMMKSMHVMPTGNPDKDFVAMMLPHHQGAVDMAKVELKYGHDPILLELAAAIIKAQESEIAMMTAWREAHAK